MANKKFIIKICIIAILITFILFMIANIQTMSYRTQNTYETSNDDFTTSSNSYQSENASSNLEITVYRTEHDGNYFVCHGKVTNNSSTKTYRYVKVKGSFKNEYEDVVDTDWTYAVGSEGLEPGESSTFRLSVNNVTGIICSCDVKLLDFD